MKINKNIIYRKKMCRLVILCLLGVFSSYMCSYTTLHLIMSNYWSLALFHSGSLAPPLPEPGSAASFFLLKESLPFPLSPKVLLISGDMIVGVFFIIWSYIIKTELKTFRKLDLSPWGHRFELVQEFQELHGWGETPTSLHSSASCCRNSIKYILDSLNFGSVGI